MKQISMKCHRFVMFTILFFHALGAQSIEIKEIKVNQDAYAYEQGADILPYSDGTFITVGQSNNRAMIMKCNNEGEITWSKIISSTQSNTFNRIIRDGNDGIVAVGTFTSFNPTANVDCFYAKYSSNGDSLWYRTFGWNGDDELSDIIRLNTGEMIALGTSELPSKRAFIVCINAIGDTLWTKSPDNMTNTSGQRLLHLNSGSRVSTLVTSPPPLVFSGPEAPDMLDDSSVLAVVHLRGLLHQAIEELPAMVGPSAVETKREFVQVVVQMVVTHCTLVGTHEPAFE